VLAEVGPEGKALATAAQVLWLVPALAAYDQLARRRRPGGISAALLALGSLGAALLALVAAGGGAVGVALHVGLGVFGLLAVTQTWSLAAAILPAGGADLARVGLGGALGAILGSLAAAFLVPRLPVPVVLVLAAGLLGLVAEVHLRIAHGLPSTPAALPSRPPPHEQRRAHSGRPAVHLVAGDAYLRLIAAFTVMASLVGTLGEYVLDRALVAELDGMRDPAAGAAIASFKGRLYGLVNVVALVLQAGLAARPLALRTALRIPPLVAAGGFAVAAAAPSVLLVAAVKGLDASLGHSLQATLRHALFLPTPEEAKYRAKALIDTGLWRLGDLAAGGLVGLGVALGAGTAHFAAANAALAVGWLGVVGALHRAHRAAARAAGIATTTVPGRLAPRAPAPAVVAYGLRTAKKPPGLPGRSIRSSAAPSSARASATSSGSSTARRSASSTTSPARSPARAAGDRGATRATTTRPSPS
jgi:AAA family ATP:ADP antiporter